MRIYGRKNGDTIQAFGAIGDPEFPRAPPAFLAVLGSEEHKSLRLINPILETSRRILVGIGRQHRVFLVQIDRCAMPFQEADRTDQQLLLPT